MCGGGLGATDFCIHTHLFPRNPFPCKPNQTKKAEVQVHHHVGWGVPVPLPGGPGATEALHQLAKDDSVVAAFALTNGGRGEVNGWVDGRRFSRHIGLF